MGAVALIVRAELRQRWRYLVLLGVLGGLVGAVVLGALIGARRTGTAFDRLVSSSRSWDAEIIGEPPDVAKAVELPEVDTSWPLSVKVGSVVDTEKLVFLGLFAGPERPPHHYDPIVLDGQLPTAVDELAISELTAKQFGRGVGDHVEWKGFTPDQFERFSTQNASPGSPEGPLVDFTITGIIRDANDALPFELAVLFTSPAFYDEVAPEVGGFDLMTAHLDRGAGDLERFRSDVEALGGASITSVHDKRPTVDSAASVAVRALVAFAAAALIAGSVALGQAARRTLILRSDDLDVQCSLGVSRRHRILALALPFGVTVAIAVALALVAATLLSSSTSGVGQGLEPHPGLSVNVSMLVLGGVGVAAFLAVIVTIAAVLQLRRGVATAPTTTAEPPAELNNLAQARGLVQLLAAFLAVLGIVAVVHALSVIARRRKHDLAVLRVLGMTGSQLRSSLRTTSAVLTGAGLLFGIPLGVLVGSVVWRELAGAVHVPADLSVPSLVIGGIILVAAVLSISLGALPVVRATRVPAATTLRTE